MTSGPRRPCRALRQQWLYHWEDGLADSASRNPQGGAGEKDVLETVVTRHKLH